MPEINEWNIRKYFSSLFGPDAIVANIEELGQGFHGTSYTVTVKYSGGREKKYILKTLHAKGFGHDYPADRANVIIRSLMDSNMLPNHIKVIDAGSIQEDNSLQSIGKPEEFFIIMDEAKGTPYWEDMDAIRDRNTLWEDDEYKIKVLADYLASIHSKKYTGENSQELYKRVVRDFIGHGELTMGVIDTFPAKLEFVNEKDLVEIVQKMIEWWSKIKDLSHRLAEVHGDFYPGNILFNDKELVLLDRSRFRYGDPADDVTCLAMNFINYSVLAHGEFRNPFKILLESFLEKYLKSTKDNEMMKVAPLFFVFRSLVCIHPSFYSPEWMKSRGFKDESIKNINANKKKIVNFAKNILNEEKFKMDKIDSYLSE